MKRALITLIILPLSITHAAILYSMDFSIDGQGATQDNSITAFTPVDVNAGDLLIIGFKVNVNGLGDVTLPITLFLFITI